MLEQAPTHETHTPPQPPDPPAHTEQRSGAAAARDKVDGVDDVRRQSPATALARVAALSHLLAARERGWTPLVEALRLGGELLPEATRLVLVARQEADESDDTSDDGSALVEVACASRPALAGAVRVERTLRPTRTLGFGDRLDRRVLQGGEPMRMDGVRCVPLRGASGPVLGALVLQGARELSTQSQDGLAIVADHLSALLERRRHEAQEQAHDAFLSLMAHELRSPLTSVKGYAQLLMRQARRGALPDTVLRSAEAIEQQAARLAEMIDELHDAARIRRDRLELLTAPTNLAPIVRQQVERWRRLSADHDYRLAIRDDESLVGEWDAHRVTQIVRDLLDNATRFSPRGGPVEIELRRDGDAALLVVRDRGIGIAPDERERIFAYRYRSRTARERHLAGLGLGLFVSRAVTERLGGRLWLQESHAGTGSELRLRLPLAEDPENADRT